MSEVNLISENILHQTTTITLTQMYVKKMVKFLINYYTVDKFV